MAGKQIQNVDIREATPKDLGLLWDMSLELGQEKDTDYFEIQFERREEDGRLILLFGAGGADAGYVILNWQPKYGFFRKLGIPEIQDLNVLPGFRRRGIATRVIEHCEKLAAARGIEYMGISVALHGASGPAQVLYAKMGYIPDGNGVTYDRKYVATGEFRPVDDQLCLMMVKSLRPE